MKEYKVQKYQHNEHQTRAPVEKPGHQDNQAQSETLGLSKGIRKQQKLNLISIWRRGGGGGGEQTGLG